MLWRELLKLGDFSFIKALKYFYSFSNTNGSIMHVTTFYII